MTTELNYVTRTIINAPGTLEIYRYKWVLSVSYYISYSFNGYNMVKIIQRLGKGSENNNSSDDVDVSIRN